MSLRRLEYQGTYFEVGLGNCGQTNVDTDMIVALATTTYASGAHCGDVRSTILYCISFDHKLTYLSNLQKVKIKSNGKTHTATVRDSCVGCDAGDLGMF